MYIVRCARSRIDQATLEIEITEVIESCQVPSLLAERARSECARSMRAVKDSPATPLNEKVWVRRGKQRALARAKGTFREVDCEAIGG